MKRIAISQRLVGESAYPEMRDALDLRWGALFEELGCLPLVLPTRFDPARYFAELHPDGLLLTGGGDLAEVRDSPEARLRDAHERRLVELALLAQIPIVGVCRGMQLLGRCFGAGLRPVEGHVRQRHRLAVSAESRFRGALEALPPVNSFHAWSLAGDAGALLVSARSEDGAVEAIEHRTLPAFGQMWHSEREEPPAAAELDLLRRALGLDGGSRG